MNKSKIFISLLILAQILQVFAGIDSYASLSLRPSESKAIIQNGACYINPGVPSSLIPTFYGLPSGWRQFQNHIAVPNVLSQSGSWVVGVRCSDGSNSFNDQLTVQISGVGVNLASSAGSSNLVIGTNFRSQGVSDSYYSNLVQKVRTSQPLTYSTSSSYGSSMIPVFPEVQFTRDNSWINNWQPRVSTEAVTNVLISTTPAFTVVSGASQEERKRALSRQFAASQALNQINTLIGQLTSNVNSASSAISRSQSEVDRLKSASSQCNDRILQFSSAKVTAESSIKELNNQLSQAQARLSDFNSALKALQDKRNLIVQQRSRIQQNRNPNSNSLFSLQQEFNSCNSQAGGLRDQYSGLVNSIQKNTDRIASIRSSSADAPRQIALIDQQISISDRTISQLQTRLRQERAKRNSLDGEKARYQSVANNLNNQISALQSQNSGLRSQLNGLQSRVDTQIVRCSSYRTQAQSIRSQLAANQRDYEQINSQILVQESLIANKQNQINRLNSDVAGIPLKRGSYQTNLNNANSALERQYSICSQSSSALAQAQSNLQAARLKQSTQSRFLSEAQSRLPSIEAEKKAADEAVNKILSSVSTVTTAPASIRVNQVSIGNFRAPITVNIQDYMTRSYGVGVRRYWQPLVQVGTPVTIMYPVSRTTWGALSGSSSAGVFIPRSSRPALSGGLGSFTCSGGSTSGYGRIQSIQPGYISILTPSNTNMNLRIGDCSKIQANRPQFVASVMDNVFYRGSLSGNQVEVHDLTCLS